MKVVAIDFEFNRSREPRVHLVCTSFQVWEISAEEVSPVSEVYEFWMDKIGSEEDKVLPRIEKAREVLKEYLVGDGYPILAFGAAAEMRSLHSMALGLPGEHEIKILDLYALQRQLTHTYPSCKWGRVLVKGELKYSKPPVYVEGEDGAIDDGELHATVGNSLADAVAHHLGKVVDTAHKNIMRDAILKEPEFWDESTATFVQAYCTSDIMYLPDLYREMMNRFMEATGQSEEYGINAMLLAGRYIGCVADSEDVGMPVNVEALYNIINNAEKALDDLIYDLVLNHYEFFTREKREKGRLRMGWVQKKTQFHKFLIEKGLFEDWPRSDKTHLPKCDEETLKAYEHIPEIFALRQVLKTKQNLGFFQPSHVGGILSRLGSDGRIRSFPNPFGTQTGRDAPKPSHGFILNMAKWLRWLVQPPKGYVIVGRDWTSQEFIVAATESQDPEMLEAYATGDVYLGFGIRSGLVPADATKKTHGEVRQSTLKPVVLGQQFGIGAYAMARKTGKTLEETKELIRIYQDTFSVYCSYKKKVLNEYLDYGSLLLPDGWALLSGQDRGLSVRNFPDQGMGGVLLRKAAACARAKRIPVIARHHDALYGMFPADKEEEGIRLITEAMDEAVEHYYPGTKIRGDVHVYRYGEGILEEDDKRIMTIFDKAKKYFTKLPTEADWRKELNGKIEQLPILPIDMDPE